jgi:ABC-type transport system involved in multi-copper enzyme maturation permease subunit
MSAPEVPSFFASVGAVFRLHALRLRRGKKLRLALAAAGLVVFGAIAARYGAERASAHGAVRAAVDTGFFGFLAYLLPFLFQAGAIAEEVEGRTFTYVASRPTGRAALTLGKQLAGTFYTGAILVVGVFVLYVGAYATQPDRFQYLLDDFAKTAGALLLLGTYYGAVCLFWGALLPEAAGILSILYLAIVELTFSKLPSVFRLASMNYRAEQLAGLPKGGLMAHTVPPLDPWLSALAIVVLTVGFSALAMVVVRVQEYRFSKA